MRARSLRASSRRARAGESRARVLVHSRSQGVCELTGCVIECGGGLEWHHRKNRSQGGLWLASNGLHICSQHHRWIGANTQRAYGLGWLVHSWDDPAMCAVILGDEIAWLGAWP